MASRARSGIGAVQRQSLGLWATAKSAAGLASATAAGQYIKAHKTASGAAMLMGAGAISSKRRGRGTSPTRGVPRGIYKY
jgi:hypothetical protein